MSMTNEEAIERLERLKRSCRDLAAGMPDEPGWTLHGMALDMALTALRPVSREKVEQLRGEWINTNNEVEQICKCSKCGYPISFFGVEHNFARNAMRP